MSGQSYAIIGSGAVGALYGAMLSRAGREVHFLLRSDFQHVREHGWVIDSHWGDFRVENVNVYASADDMPACDVTIVALKTVHNALLPELLARPMSGGGVVLTLQNGLGVENDLANLVDAERVFGGCCFLCSNKVGPGHIRHLDYGRVVFGPWQKTPETLSRAERICAEMSEAGIEVAVSDDLRMVRWRKLMWNIPFNGLSVALDAQTDQLIGDEGSLELIRDVITEVHRAARACGAEIGDEWIEKTIDHTRTMVPYDSSMRLDFLAGRPMELKTILQNPIEAGVAAGVEMAKTRMLWQILRFIETRAANGGSLEPDCDR